MITVTSSVNLIFYVINLNLFLKKKSNSNMFIITILILKKQYLKNNLTSIDCMWILL